MYCSGIVLSPPGLWNFFVTLVQQISILCISKRLFLCIKLMFIMMKFPCYYKKNLFFFYVKSLYAVICIVCFWGCHIIFCVCLELACYVIFHPLTFCLYSASLINIMQPLLSEWRMPSCKHKYCSVFLSNVMPFLVGDVLACSPMSSNKISPSWVCNFCM